MFFYCLQSMFSNRKVISISCINSCNHRPTKLLSGEIKLISITQTQAGGCVQKSGPRIGSANETILLLFVYILQVYTT